MNSYEFFTSPRHWAEQTAKNIEFCESIRNEKEREFWQGLIKQYWRQYRKLLNLK